jgi:hypothetical protein
MQKALVSLKAGDWAAWVQAVGSILAIAAGFGTVIFQNRHSDRMQEAERARRAEVVAYRISVWLSEVGTSIDSALRKCRDSRANLQSGQPQLYGVHELRMGTATSIHGVLPDLHYLLEGSGDIAQLEHLMRIYEAWLDRLNVERIMEGPQSQEINDQAERQLLLMRMLHANAERHIRLLIKKGD